MSFETRFTPDEQKLLSNFPRLISTAMSFAGASGLGTVKEMIASSQSFLKGKSYTANEIITGILPNMQDVKEAMKDSREMRTDMMDHLKANEVKSKEELEALALEDARRVNYLLATKASAEEAGEYKNWVLQITDDVANAAKEGGLLGFGGTHVSEGEEKLRNDLVAALNNPSAGNLDQLT